MRETDRHKCTHCGHRTQRGSYAGIRTSGGREQPYCTHRRACRVALQRRFMETPLTFEWGTDITYSAAAEAADLVEFPRWLRWLPRSTQNEIRARFIRKIASAVDQRQAEAAAADHPDATPTGGTPASDWRLT